MKKTLILFLFSVQGIGAAVQGSEVIKTESEHMIEALQQDDYKTYLSLLDHTAIPEYGNPQKYNEVRALVPTSERLKPGKWKTLKEEMEEISRTKRKRYSDLSWDFVTARESIGRLIIKIK